MLRRSFLTLLCLSATSLAACVGQPDDGATREEQDQTSALACQPSLACAAPKLAHAPIRDWRHGIKSRLDAASGSPNHRGRDLFVNPGAKQTVIAKFAYGVIDKDLEDEEVDVYVQRDCATAWEKLGTARTTGEGAPHPTVEGVEDTDGRIYFEIPAEKQLGPGKHRIRLVVAGDGSMTDLFIDVVPPKRPIFVSDVDGTLTSSENIEFLKLLEGELPETHPGAPEALRALAAKGYRPIYLTARPEWLVQRTRDFLEARGFPPGLVHTSTSALGEASGRARRSSRPTSSPCCRRRASSRRSGSATCRATPTRMAPRTCSPPITAFSTKSTGPSTGAASSPMASWYPGSGRFLRSASSLGVHS